MLTEDKVTEVFVMAYEFCKVFNQMHTQRFEFPKNRETPLFSPKRHV